MESNGDNFITQYLHYVGETEAPIFYHRWSILSAVGAYLGRQYFLPFGHGEILPNLYVMLIGDPGTRKSTAIKLAKKILTGAGYTTISAERSSKEKFIMDLAGEDNAGSGVDILDQNLWGKEAEEGKDAEMFIACDEFNDFIGLGNLEFISLLGTLWDFKGPYDHRTKTSKSVIANNPTISILGGNTPVSFANAFPHDVIGQGFFSRLLLVYGESTGKKIPFPETPSIAATGHITRELQRIKLTSRGQANFNPNAKDLLSNIYKTYKPIDDSRFIHYSNRRFTHLLKLCLVISACDFSTSIEERHVVEANTILTHTEHLMPKALGQFGKARNSDVTHKIMTVLADAESPMAVKDIWRHVYNDMEKLNDLVDMLRNLLAADKIFNVNGGYLAKARKIVEENSDMINYSYLTEEERGMRK